MFRLHHIGILVKDIPAAAEPYISQFGYRIKSPIIHDPRQTAHVQFLQLEGESSYIEFVSPDGPGSKLSNALKKGGGLNHICYSVIDIEQACRVLSEKTMLILQEPAPAVAFAGRRIAWLAGEGGSLVELVERAVDGDL